MIITVVTDETRKEHAHLEQRQSEAFGLLETRPGVDDRVVGAALCEHGRVGEQALGATSLDEGRQDGPDAGEDLVTVVVVPEVAAAYSGEDDVKEDGLIRCHWPFGIAMAVLSL